MCIMGINWLFYLFFEFFSTSLLEYFSVVLSLVSLAGICFVSDYNPSFGFFFFVCLVFPFLFPNSFVFPFFSWGGTPFGRFSLWC